VCLARRADAGCGAAVSPAQLRQGAPMVADSDSDSSEMSASGCRTTKSTAGASCPEVSSPAAACAQRLSALRGPPDSSYPPCCAMRLWDAERLGTCTCFWSTAGHLAGNPLGVPGIGATTIPESKLRGEGDMRLVSQSKALRGYPTLWRRRARGGHRRR